MSFFNFRPARQAVLDDVKIVTDLDRMISEPVGFIWAGKRHLIKPMTTETFLKISEELARLELIRAGAGTHLDQVAVVNTFTRLFMTVCDSITRRDVMKMTASQRGALFQQIMDCVTGRAHAQQAEKKTLQIPFPKEEAV